MHYLIYLSYPLLILLILRGCKCSKKGEWNEDFLSLSQTKALQGFCSLCVILHHISQKTCAPWLPSEVITHGLDFFVPIGYLLVAVFFFYSGYGLSKSYQEKANYLQNFLGRRCFPLLLILLLTDIATVCIRNHMKESISFSGPFHLNGPLLLNGYSWFVYALLFFYLCFYLAHKYCKSEKAATFFVLLGVLFYIFFCDWWMYGTWWYNSALLFAIGILFARHEVTLIRSMRKYYKAWLPVACLVTVLFFTLGEYTKSVPAQIASGCAFVLLLLLVTMKIKIGNRILAILGSITLELYLLHSVFLQVFGFNESVSNPYQIKNVTLLVLAVLICTFLTAIPLHKLLSGVTAFLLKQKEMTALLWKDFKRFLKVSLILLAVLTLFSVVNHHKTRRDAQEITEAYISSNISFATIDGEKMAARITGEGKHTIVFLRGQDDPCPTLTLSSLADALSDQNRVIILDYFGCGFSDSTDRERTAENFVYEIRTALQELGAEGPYIFAAHELSGLYAQLYMQTYPDEVEAIVGLDSSVAAQPEDMLLAKGMTPKTYAEQLKKQGILNSALRSFLYTTGYGRNLWPLYERGIKARLTKEEYTILEEQFVENYYSPNSMAEMVLKYENHLALLHQKYPQDLPALFILSDYACNGPLYPGSDWIALHEDLCTNPQIQKTVTVPGSPYFVYYNADETAVIIQNFIDSLDTGR